MGPSGHIDTFSRDRLPPAGDWPDLVLKGFSYPEYLNAAVELTDGIKPGVLFLRVEGPGGADVQRAMKQ